MKYLLILGMLGCGILPSYAQWYKRAAQATARIQGIEQYGMTAAQAALMHATEAAARQAALATAQLTRAEQDMRALEQAIVTVQESHWFLRMGNDLKATTFVIEETYQGKTYHWGITAGHYLFQKPAMKLLSGGKLIRVPFVAQGSVQMSDVALFPLPPEVAERVRPLPLATETPQLGDELHSIGYFDGETHLETGRRVLAINEQRMITSLNVDGVTNREGACGSPVLNEKNEVVGVHLGSSQTKQEGFVVPSGHIRWILASYHRQNDMGRAVMVNNKEIGALKVNEGIALLDARKAGKTLRIERTYHREMDVDYNHLEDFIDLTDADELRIVIIEYPFSMLARDQHIHAYVWAYNLQTGQQRRWQDDSLAPRF